MSFLSGLSSIFHGIGHIFDHNDQQNQQQNKNNNPHPQSLQAAPSPVLNQPQPQQQQQPQQAPPDNSINLTQLAGSQLQKAPQAQKPAPFDAAPPEAAPQFVQPKLQPLPAAPSHSLQAPSKAPIIGPTANPILDAAKAPNKNLAANGEPVDWNAFGRSLIAAPLSTAVGAAKGITDLYDLATPGKGQNTISRGLGKIDDDIGAYAGPGQGEQSMNQLKTALLPTTLIGPGELVKAVQGAHAATDALEGVPRVVTGLQKAKAIGQKVIDARPTLGTAEDATKVAEGVHSVNPTQAADAAQQVQEQQAATQPPTFMQRVDNNQSKAVQDSQQAPAVADINNELHTNATSVAADPAHEPMISDAYRTSGSTNPLSLVMHGLSKMTNKAQVRDIVQRLVPDAKGNVLNRAVNAITGADDPVEVSQALTEASSGAKTTAQAPFGPLSDAPAPSPAVGARVADNTTLTPQPPEATTPDVAPEAPVPTPATDPVTHTMPDGSTGRPLTNVEEVQRLQQSRGEQPTVQHPADMPVTGDTAPVAPRTYDASVGHIADSDLQKAFKGGNKTRNVVHVDDLHAQAAATIDKMAPGEVAQMYAQGTPEFKNPQEFINAVHALDMLGAAPQTETTASAVDHLLEGIAEFQSKSGTNMRVGQVLWDKMPIQMKKASLINRLTRNGVDVSKADEDGLMARLQASEEAKQAAAAAEQGTDGSRGLAQIEEGMRVYAKDPTAPGAIDPASVTSEVKTLTKQYDNALRTQEFADGQAMDYYKSLLPKTALGDRLAQDTRVFMLSGVTGRIHDFISTGAVTAVDTATNVGQALQGKVLNAVRGNHDAMSTLPSLRKIVGGAVTGLKDTGRSMFKGDHRVSDFQGMVKNAANRSNLDQKGGVSWKNPLQKVGNITKNLTVGATESPTFMTQGLANSKLYQGAMQEGKQMGYTGQALKNFAETSSRLRSKAEQAAAQQEHLKVNNLHQNRLTKMAADLTASVQKAGKGTAWEHVMPHVINQIAPFTSWVAGNIQRTFTDANVLHNIVEFKRAAQNGDVDGMTKAVAKFGTNAGVFATGMSLAADGHITSQDANGNNYAGGYFHFGNRYIPVAVLGPYAAPLLFGQAAHEADQKPGGLTDPKNLGSAVLSASGNITKSIGVSSTLGGSNAVQSGIAGISSGKQTEGTALTKFASGVVGQYIPSATGDVNSVMDVHTNADPTHEAPDTKAYKTNDKGNQVVDQTKTAENQILAKIPGLEQHLPRKAGTPARDLTDRSLQGTHDTSKMVDDRATQATVAKQQQDQATFDKQNDIPDPNATYKGADSFDKAVEARIQRGDFDKAAQAYQQKLDVQLKDKNIPQSDNQSLQNKISQLKIAKEHNLSFDDMKLYNDTSLTEWRNMGDSTSDTYDQATYDKLYNIDSALAKGKVAGAFDVVSSSSNSKLSDQNKYSAKKPSKASTAAASRKAATAAANLVKSNTIGSLPTLGNISFGNLAPQKITSAAAIPTIQQLKGSDLIKKRTISVSAVK